MLPLRGWRSGGAVPPPPEADESLNPSSVALLRAAEQGPSDRLPFLLQGCCRSRAAGPAIPAAGVRKVAFDAMQIGMRPGALGVCLLLSTLMRQMPIALCFPPQRLRRRVQAIGRRLRGKRALIRFEIHLVFSSPGGNIHRHHAN